MRDPYLAYQVTYARRRYKSHPLRAIDDCVSVLLSKIYITPSILSIPLGGGHLCVILHMVPPSTSSYRSPTSISKGTGLYSGGFESAASLWHKMGNESVGRFPALVPASRFLSFGVVSNAVIDHAPSAAESQPVSWPCSPVEHLLLPHEYSAWKRDSARAEPPLLAASSSVLLREGRLDGTDDDSRKRKRPVALIPGHHSLKDHDGHPPRARGHETSVDNASTTKPTRMHQTFLSEEQRRVLGLVASSNKSVFFTGSAGECHGRIADLADSNMSRHWEIRTSARNRCWIAKEVRSRARSCCCYCIHGPSGMPCWWYYTPQICWCWLRHRASRAVTEENSTQP